MAGPGETLGSLWIPLAMGVWEGVAMDSLEYHPGLPCLTLLRSAGGPPSKLSHRRFCGGPLAGQAAFSRLLPFWTPHTALLWSLPYRPTRDGHPLGIINIYIMIMNYIFGFGASSMQK
jgi:hypothetical protein